MGPCGEIGEIVVARLTVLLKPFVPLIVMVKLAEVPLSIVWLAGVTVIVKSGGADTVMETLVERNMAPLVPVTIIV